MHIIHLSSGIELYGTRASRFGIRSGSILASVINVEVAKTNTSFLATYSNTYLYNILYSYNRSI